MTHDFSSAGFDARLFNSDAIKSKDGLIVIVSCGKGCEAGLKIWAFQSSRRIIICTPNGAYCMFHSSYCVKHQRPASECMLDLWIYQNQIAETETGEWRTL